MSRLDQLTRLHEADPADPFCTYGIALEYAKEERPGEAIDWLRKTLDLDPQYCYAYYQMAKVHSDQGDDEAARAAITAGMKAAKQAGDEHAHSELTELLEALG